MTHTREQAHREALSLARSALSKLDPSAAAFRAGGDYRGTPEKGTLAVTYFGDERSITWPEPEITGPAGTVTDLTEQLLILHYLLHAEGVRMADQWVAFRELPDAMTYDSAFQGRSSLRLAQRFGQDGPGFEVACRKLGGEKLTFGDVSYAFAVLPHLRMAAILHLADEEFGATANVLFDAAAGQYLPTEDLAVLGGLLASKLVKAAV